MFANFFPIHIVDLYYMFSEKFLRMTVFLSQQYVVLPSTVLLMIVAEEILTGWILFSFFLSKDASQTKCKIHIYIICFLMYVYLSKLVLPSTDSLPSGGEETLIGWILFSLFLLLDASWMLILTSSSATSLEIVEILIDWIEFSLVTTLLGRTPSSLFSAMIPDGSYVPSMVL